MPIAALWPLPPSGRGVALGVVSLAAVAIAGVIDEDRHAGISAKFLHMEGLLGPYPP
jgi:hypothetical protein